VSGGAGVTSPHDVLLLVPLVIFVAYLVFGITGFGASPITIPILVHLLPLAFVLPLAALLDLGSALALGFHTRQQADTRELVTLVPFTLIGLTLGVTLLLRLPRDATLLALGLFVCAYAVNLMLRREARRQSSRRWAAIARRLSRFMFPTNKPLGPRQVLARFGPRSAKYHAGYFYDRVF
jgi:uncharacterized membrane protein YfcA